MEIKKSVVFFVMFLIFLIVFHCLANEKMKRLDKSGCGLPGRNHQLLKEMYAFLTKACTRQTPGLIQVVSHGMTWLARGSIT